MAAETHCIEEPCNVELNEEPGEESTEQPYGTQINIIHCKFFCYNILIFY